jgi:collagenase-like PrtC family protease
VRGLIKATAYFSTQQAKADFYALAKFAVENGAKDEVALCTPPKGAGHKTIDRQIAKLRKLLADKGLAADRQDAGGE